MTNVWVTTDTYFHHEAMCKYSQRPIDFTERIIADWKGEVAEDDLVIHLGDVTWKEFELDRLMEMLL